MDILLNYKISPEIAMTGYLTPLCESVHNNHQTILHLLLKYQADVNAQSSFNGTTALHVAVSRGNRDMVSSLLEVKANPNLHNFDGETQLMTATSCLSNVIDKSGSRMPALLSMSSFHHDRIEDRL